MGHGGGRRYNTMTVLTTPRNCGKAAIMGVRGAGGSEKGMFGAIRGHFNSSPLLYGLVYLRIVIGGRSSAQDHIWILSSQLL